METHDKRTHLIMSEKERTEFLAEMRQILSSIQGIITGIGIKDKGLISQSAQRSDASMEKVAQDSAREIFPHDFQEIKRLTYVLFEELAQSPDTDDVDELAELTGQLMQQCQACHAAFKVKQ